jgi:hypothetical protein
VDGGAFSFTPWSLYSKGESPWYPLDRRLGGPRNRSGHGGEENNSQYCGGCGGGGFGGGDDNVLLNVIVKVIIIQPNLLERSIETEELNLAEGFSYVFIRRLPSLNRAR